VCLLSEEVAILREFGEDYEWFLKSRSKLLSEYANKWVAIRKKKILDFDNELTPLLKRLGALGSNSMKITGYINYGYRPPAPFVTASILLKELNLKVRLPLHSFLQFFEHDFITEH